MILFSSPQQKREDYLVIEAELIELALRSENPSSDRQQTNPLPTIIPFDTRVPALPDGGTSTQQTTGYCQVDGKCSHYKIHGISIKSPQNAEGTKQTTPIVLLHGYGNSAAFYYRSWRELSKHFTTVYALDLLGFGASSRPVFTSNTTFQAETFFVASLEAWRKAMQLDSNMILVGHSLGGYLAVAYCERYPQHVQHLHLLSPVGIPYETKETIEQRNAMRNSSSTRRLAFMALECLSPVLTFGHVLRSVPRFVAHGYLIPLWMKRFERTVPNGQERFLLGLAGYRSALLPGSGEFSLMRILNTFVYAREPLVDRIPKLSLRSCCIYYGDRDWMNVQAGLSVSKVKQQSGSVSVYRVRNSGHMILVDNPVEFVNGIVQNQFSPGRLEPDDPIPDVPEE